MIKYIINMTIIIHIDAIDGWEKQYYFGNQMKCSFVNSTKSFTIG